MGKTQQAKNASRRLVFPAKCVWIKETRQKNAGDFAGETCFADLFFRISTLWEG
jgi:hypothetical protein